MSANLSKRITDDHKAAFHNHLLQSLATMGNAAVKQQFYITFMHDYRGLSRSGKKLLSQLNVGLPARTYDTYRAAAAEEANNRAR